MAKKANEKIRLAKMAGNKAKPEKTKEDKRQVGKTALRPSEVITIDFNKYPNVLKQVVDLAEDEIRPLDLQIIYLLKQHFDTLKPSSRAV